MQSNIEEMLPVPGLETSSDDEDYQPNGTGADMDMDEANQEGSGTDADGQPEAEGAENGMAQQYSPDFTLLSFGYTMPAKFFGTAATDSMLNTKPEGMTVSVMECNSKAYHSMFTRPLWICRGESSWTVSEQPIHRRAAEEEGPHRGWSSISA